MQKAALADRFLLALVRSSSNWRRDWAGSTFVKTAERTVRCANPVVVRGAALSLR
jgi:hypothetical protein